MVRERWHYLAAVLDLKTRQVVGWRLGTRHTSELTHEALLDALSKHQELCAKMEIALNASNESSPWQNGFMERWFGGFKRELGNPAHYEDLAALHEAILINQIRKLLKSIKLPQEKLPGLVAEIEKNHASEQEHYTTTKQRLQKEYDDLDVELDGLFKDKKMFKNQHERFERMVKDIEKKQKDILEDLKDHSDGDKAFVIGASYLLDVCSRAVELFDAESTKVEQKRYLIGFVLSNVTLDGKNLHFTLKEPFEAIINVQKNQKWYTQWIKGETLYIKTSYNWSKN